MHIVFKVKSKRVLPQGKALFSLQKKSVFYKIMRILYPYENALWALRPCKAFGRSISASLPNPQTPSPWEGAILMGLPPLVQARMLAVSHPKPLHDAVAQMADDLYGGYAPKQGRFGCLPKVLHDAKPTEQAISDTHFLISRRFFDRLKPRWMPWLFSIYLW